MGLLESALTKTTQDNNNSTLPVPPNSDAGLESSVLVFFDLETSGLSANCDVLQIAMRSNENVFNMYIDPSPHTYIHEKATEANGLTIENGKLFLRGVKVQSEPLPLVLRMLHLYLQSLGKPCVLVAHNCSFDSTRLLRIIGEANLVREFGEVIAGFTDTLILFREKFPQRKTKGACTLTTLASETLSLCIKGAHDASKDVLLLEKLALHHFPAEKLAGSNISYTDLLELQLQAEKAKDIFWGLQPLKDVISAEMRRRLAKAGITYELIVNTYREKGKLETIALLQQNVDGKPQVIKTNRILEAITGHLEQRQN